MKLAIIGASFGQYPLCKKAKELGYETICFAWKNDAVCEDVVDKFYPISIHEMDKILEICGKEKIDGVISNASDATAECVSYIATKMGLHGIDFENFRNLKDKSIVRRLSSNVPGLSKVYNEILSDSTTAFFPCILKPVTGNSKKGVILASTSEDLEEAKKYAKEGSNCDIIIEQYISGREISVESISFEGKHHIIQITDKDSSGAPHFVELGHHQPSTLPLSVIERIRRIIPELLDSVCLYNGATHVEMKVSEKGDIYLIEINPRGGGDNISNTLVQLSSGIDYLRCIIEVALGIFKAPVKVSEPAYAGIYYLCKQTSYLLPFFKESIGKDWAVDVRFNNSELKESTGNYVRDGYLIYKSSEKIIPGISQ